MGEEQLGDKLHYGGQAVIEGVMMRSPRFFAVACRRENNEIVVQQESAESLLKRLRWLNKPFLRGALALIDAMVLGMKSLMFSANVAMEDIEQSKPEKSKEADRKGSDFAGACPAVENGEPAKAKGQSVNDVAIGATMVAGLALGIGIFMIGPHLVAGLLERWVKGAMSLNLVEGGIRIAFVVGYIAAISLMKDIRRVFEYHGAEHKVINAFEADIELTPENIGKHGTMHPRCGTSFILVVLVVSILAYSFLGRADGVCERVLYRLLLLPVIAGVAYEVVKFAGKYKDSRVLGVILAPGLWLQKLTAREPTQDQVEVAVRALRAVIDKERETAAAN